MTIGLIGLDDNGVSLAQALNKHRITVIGYDYENTHRKRSAELGIVTTSSIQAVALHLPAPRIIWNLKVESTNDNSVLNNISKFLSPDDIIIDSSGISRQDLIHELEILQALEIRLLRCKPVQPEPNAIAWITGDRQAFKLCKSMFQAHFGDNSYQYVGDISSQ